jgi:hypothetical protein
VSTTPDAATLLKLLADITLGTAAVLDELTTRLGQEDLSAELEALRTRTLEVIDLEQQLRRER